MLVDAAKSALDTVERALPYLVAGPPLPGPPGPVLDIPILYDGVALDRMHVSLRHMTPLPKGCAGGECLEDPSARPRPYPGPPPATRCAPALTGHPEDVDLADVREAVEKALRELRVLDAVEYRGPEAAWAVPVAWRSLVVLHIRVSRDGSRLLPDPGLTAELRRLRLL